MMMNDNVIVYCQLLSKTVVKLAARYIGCALQNSAIYFKYLTTITDIIIWVKNLKYLDILIHYYTIVSVVSTLCIIRIQLWLVQRVSDEFFFFKSCQIVYRCFVRVFPFYEKSSFTMGMAFDLYVPIKYMVFMYNLYYLYAKIII